MNLELIVQATANQAIKNLNDDELVALNLAINLENPNIKNVIGYDKVKALFTENDGTRCHSLVANAFAKAVMERL